MNQSVGERKQTRKPPFPDCQHSLTASSPMQREATARHSASSSLGERASWDRCTSSLFDVAVHFVVLTIGRVGDCVFRREGFRAVQGTAPSCFKVLLLFRGRAARFVRR